jgi:hypothetical protein
MGRAADEPEVVLPADRHRQVLRRDVVPIALLRRDEDERRDREEPLPDRRFGREVDQVLGFGNVRLHDFMLRRTESGRIGSLADATFGELPSVLPLRETTPGQWKH